MKKRCPFPLLFYFVCCLSLSLFVGCGDAQDIDESPTHITPEETTDAVEDTYPPRDWHKTEDPELYAEYFRAVLIKKFGDIPPVHIVVEDARKMMLGLPQTYDEFIATLEATYQLWPNEANRRALEHFRKRKAEGVQINIINLHAPDEVLIKQLMKQRKLTRKEAEAELKKIRAEQKKMQEAARAEAEKEHDQMLEQMRNPENADDDDDDV